MQRIRARYQALPCLAVQSCFVLDVRFAADRLLKQVQLDTLFKQAQSVSWCR